MRRSFRCRVRPTAYASGAPVRKSTREHRLEILEPLAAVRLLARRVIGRQRSARPAQVILRQLGEKSRWLAFASLACMFAPAAERQMEASLRARHADVEK